MTAAVAGAGRPAERGEARAFAVLLLACALLFVAQWPVILAEAAGDPSIPREARMAGALMAWLFVAPLLAYAAAGLSALAVPRLDGAGARRALFGAMLRAAPVFMLNGLVGVLVGGAAFVATQIAAVAAFLLLWVRGVMRERRR